MSADQLAIQLAATVEAPPPCMVPTPATQRRTSARIAKTPVGLTQLQKAQARLAQ